MSRDLWVRRGCALVVAVVAAYVSFEHQRRFALAGGADEMSAALWPLSVDGLVVLASIGLVGTGSEASARARWSVRVAFVLGVAVSLVANVAAAPVLAWRPVVVAGWPPVALLLAVELLASGPVRRLRAGDTDTPMLEDPRPDDSVEPSVSGPRSGAARREVSRGEGGRVRAKRPGRGSAEEAMWSHFRRTLDEGRELTGADLDRLAGTNNYGRSVLARWRRSGRIREYLTSTAAEEVMDSDIGSGEPTTSPLPAPRVDRADATSGAARSVAV